MWFVLPVAAAEIDLDLVADGFDLTADTERSVERILSRVIAADETWLSVLLPQSLSVRVTLVQGQARFREIASRTPGTSPQTVGFFLPGRSEAVILRDGDDVAMRKTLVHETSHFLLQVGGMARVPLWLNEGLAELYGSAVLDGNSVRLPPDSLKLSYIASRPLPKAASLIGGSPQDWDALGKTPWSHAEYPYGWALCSMLLSTTSGRKTLSEILVASAVSPEPAKAALEAASTSYPGGLDALERSWVSFIRGGGTTIELPIQTSSGQSDGWGRCPDGSLVRLDSGAVCSAWVPGKDGVLRYVEQRPVAD